MSIPKVILYYTFTPLTDPAAIKVWQKNLCQGLNLKGRIIISPHGINGTLGGDIDDLKKYITDNNIRDYVFLISAGPFANILVHQLHNFNKNNTYLDIGSTIDGYLKLPLTRRYLKGGDTLNKTCIW